MNYTDVMNSIKNLISYPHLFLGRRQSALLLLLFIFLLYPFFSCGNWVSVKKEQKPFAAANGSMVVGVASIDITPEGPIMLAGYGNRQNESEGVLQRLGAKALAFGSDAHGPLILISVDLIGIPGYLTTRLEDRLSKNIGLDPARLVISSTHIHSGPEIGTLLNHFGRQLPPDQVGHIIQYLDQLAPKLEQVALAALKSRKPALVAWGQGQVGFAMNRRMIKNGKGVGIGVVPEGPVDHSLPMLRITDLDGKLVAVLVNYACHNTTIGGNINQIHGDWAGEAQRLIEANHPGATALVSLGCGADANPEPRGRLEQTTMHGQAVADEVERLLASSLQPLAYPPVGRFKQIELPYAHVPTSQELLQNNDKGAKGYYYRLALDQVARGEAIPTSLSYPIKTWTFGNDLAMVFLAGEVVVDYSLRLKKELGAERLWITAFANDVPCYIASRRVIQEGGYEVESSMYSYNRPSRFSEVVEDLIVATVYDLLPESYKPKTVNRDLGQSK